MKTKTIILSILLALPMWTLADETKTKVFPTDAASRDVNLDYTNANCIFIGRALLSSAVPGNIIRLHGWNTGDAPRRILIGQYKDGENIIALPGGETKDVTWSDGAYDFCLTKDMLYKIIDDNKDLRIFGEGITVNVVDLVQPGKTGAFHEPFNTIWEGLLWVDNNETWPSTEIYATTLSPHGDFSKIRAIRIYHDAAHNDYTINLLDNSWTNIAGTGNTMTKHNGYVEVVLDNTMRGKLNSGNSVRIQGHIETGIAGFNIKDVVLIPFSPDGCDNCFYVY